MLINRLAILLAERSMSGVRLANDTGIAQSTISKIASNKSKQIDYDTVNKICNTLGVTPNDFFDYSPIDYEINYFKDEETKEMFTLIKISDRDTHVATLEYKINIKFHVNTDKADNPVDIEEIRHSFYTEVITVEARLEKQNSETYEKFTNLPSNFKNIFTNDLLREVGRNIREYILEEFTEYTFKKNVTGQIHQLFGEGYQILVSAKIDGNDELPF